MPFENLVFRPQSQGGQICVSWAHPLGPGLGPPTWAQLGPTQLGPDAGAGAAGRILKSRSRPLPTHPGMKYFREETLAVDTCRFLCTFFSLGKTDWYSVLLFRSFLHPLFSCCFAHIASSSEFHLMYSLSISFLSASHRIQWQILYHMCKISTARVSLAKYFIPGCVERGLVLDLRVCPQAAPAASGNLGFCPLGIEVEKQGF